MQTDRPLRCISAMCFRSDGFMRKINVRKNPFFLPDMPVFRKNDITREIDEHLANLRASPRERQALEDRVLHHLSKESKHRARHDGGLPSGEGDMSLCSNDSVGSLTSDGELTQGRRRKRCTHRRRKGRRDCTVVGATRRRLSASARASEASERILAQTLHAQDVVRRKRYHKKYA